MNAKDEFGYTPLHAAASKGRTGMKASSTATKTYETVELLIAKGADVNAKVDDGRTPLDIVLAQKQKRTIPSRRVRRNDQPVIAYLLRKHGGKTGEELKAEGK